MSRIFYDHLLVLEDVKVRIERVTNSREEKEEFWQLIDEIIHHRILNTILEELPSEHHDEFLKRFYESPYEESLIPFLNDKLGHNIELIIKAEANLISDELLQLMDKKIKK